MLTFIDKNEVYSERKFDEVSNKKRYSFSATQFHLFLWIFVSLLLYPVEDFYK